MALYSIQGETLSEIADAIREKTETEEPIQTNEMSSMIRKIEGGSPNAVLYTEQNLTDEQKAQARENIGAAAIGEGGGSSENAVLYTEQNLTLEQKNQARKNIDIHVGEEPADADEGAVWIDPDGMNLILGNAIMAEDTNDGDVEIFGSFISEDTVIAKDENSDGNIILQTYISEEEKTGTNKFLQSITFPGLPDTYTVPSKAEDVGAASLEYVRQIGNPRNLLDNSDFTNPVNQRGKTEYLGGNYSIDRWRAYHADTIHKVTNDGLSISGTSNINLYQPLNSSLIDTNKVYTAAACDSDGNISIWSGRITTTIGAIGIYISQNRYLFRLVGEKVWKWAALYEGEYTRDTLPPYTPKGYAAELLECQRYFINLGNSSFGFGFVSANGTSCGIIIPMPTKMRAIPTVTADNFRIKYRTLQKSVSNFAVTEINSSSILLTVTESFTVDSSGSGAPAIAFSNGMTLSADL